MRNLVPLYTALLLGGAAVLCQPSTAQITAAPGGGYDFHTKYTAGQRIQYQMTTQSSAPQLPSGSMAMSMPMSYHVLDVQKGVATIDMTVGPVQMNGKAMAPAQTLKVQIDDKGHVKGDNPGLASMGDLSATLPTHALRVGESYSLSKTVPLPSVGNLQTTTKYTFSGFETVQGVKSAVLTFSATGKNAQMSTDTKGTVLMSTADGTMIKLSGASTTSMSAGGQNMTISQKIAITRK